MDGDGRRRPSDGNSSRCLWQDELKSRIKKAQQRNKTKQNKNNKTKWLNKIKEQRSAK